MNTLALATQLWCGFVTLGARGEIMNNPSYEPFIRICQGCLININGTSPHFSNRSHCSPRRLFFLLLILQSPFLPITISPPPMVHVYLFSPFCFLARFILSSFSIVILLAFPSSYLNDLQSSANEEWVVPPLLLPPFSLSSVQHLHPPSSSPSFPSCYLFLSLPLSPHPWNLSSPICSPCLLSLCR